LIFKCHNYSTNYLFYADFCLQTWIEPPNIVCRMQHRDWFCAYFIRWFSNGIIINMTLQCGSILHYKAATENAGKMWNLGFKDRTEGITTKLHWKRFETEIPLCGSETDKSCIRHGSHMNLCSRLLTFVYTGWF
jgi:hypothetical protein